MGTQVHFLGVEVSAQRAYLSLMRRDGEVVCWGTETLTPERREGPFYVFRPALWARRIAEAAHQLIESSGVPPARIWGYAPVAPPGWICLDAQLAPLTDLFVSEDEELSGIADYVQAFLQRTPRAFSRIGLLTAPKDFLRLHWSKVIATDSTTAASFGLLSPSRCDWDRDRIFEKDLDPGWLPPVFPSAFACGRVGQGGTEQVGLSGSAWVAAGSGPAAARACACGEVGEPCLYVFAGRPDHAYWYERDDSLPEPFLRSAALGELPAELAGPEVPVVADWREGEDPRRIIRWARAAGKAVYRAPFAGGISPGAAVIAALASGAYASRKSFYRRFPAPSRIAEEEETTGQ